MASVSKRKLFDSQVITATNTNSTAQQLQQGWKKFALYVNIEAITATNVTVTLQHSADGTNWHSVVATSALTGTGVTIIMENNFTIANSPLFANVRAVLTGTAITTVTVSAHLLYDEDCG